MSSPQISLDMLARAIEQALADEKSIRYRTQTGAVARLAGVRKSLDETFLVLSSTECVLTVCKPKSNRWNNLVGHVIDYLSEGARKQ